MRDSKPEEIIVESPESKRKRFNKILYVVIALLLFWLVFAKFIPFLMGLFFLLLKVLFSAAIVYMILRFVMNRKKT
jgi:hypothetical protein